MKRTLSILLCLALLLGAIPLPAHAQSETVLTLAVPQLWRDMIDMPALIADFEATQRNVRVEVVYQDNTLGRGGGATTAEATFESAEALASSADVVYVDSNILGVVATRAGYFLDLTPLVNSDAGLNVNDFYPAIWQSFQWDDGLWALPVSASMLSISYNVEAFDRAGLPYPSESWSLTDWFDAATALTTYDADGKVEVPGMLAGLGNAEFATLMRTASGTGFYDSSAYPELPRLATPELETLLTDWLALVDDGIIQQGFSDKFGDIPIRLGSGVVRIASDALGAEAAGIAPFPTGVYGLTAQWFALSSGTRYPEAAYQLARYLSSRPDVGQNLLGDTAARQSLNAVNVPRTGVQGVNPVLNTDLDPLLQAELDGGLRNTLPASEVRYGDYLTTAFNAMRLQRIDANNALQDAETQAVNDLSAALDQRANVFVIVNTPVRPTVGKDEIILETGYSLGVGSGVRLQGGGLPNEAGWMAVNDSFAINDPVVGIVNTALAEETTLAALAATYDCFITSTNLATSADLSPLMSLDPFIDADFDFDRNAVIGNVLVELQGEDGRTWGYPIVVDPQTLDVDADQFARAGLDVPTAGWTIDEFTDALTTLEEMNGTAPYQPNEPSGNYLLWLIGAYGGLPMDYRSDPPTLNFTDPATVAAIRQVLDLAKNGYMDYSGMTTLGGLVAVRIGSNEAGTPISGNFNLGGLGPRGAGANTTLQGELVEVPYPSGNDYIPLSFTITAGYISAQADDPAACYRWFGAVADNPDLLGGVPALRTTPVDTEDDAMLAYLESVLDAPTLMTFPGQAEGVFSGTYWLYRAFDRYVLEDADLEYELSEAQIFTQGYQDCIAGVDLSDGIDVEVFMAFQRCTTSVDPTYGQ